MYISSTFLGWLIYRLKHTVLYSTKLKVLIIRHELAGEFEGCLLTLILKYVHMIFRNFLRVKTNTDLPLNQLMICISYEHKLHSFSFLKEHNGYFYTALFFITLQSLSLTRNPCPVTISSQIPHHLVDNGLYTCLQFNLISSLTYYSFPCNDFLNNIWHSPHPHS